MENAASVLHASFRLHLHMLQPDQQGCTCRPGVACSVTGVGEAIMRTGLARAVAKQLSASADSTVDSVCEVSIRQDILQGQPAAVACPHKDCGILAVRVNAQGGPCCRHTGMGLSHRVISRAARRMQHLKTLGCCGGVVCRERAT